MTEGTSPTASEPSNGLPEPAASVPTSKGSWPTDPRSLGLDPAEIALHADGDWKPAHHKLLTSLGLAYRDLVNRTLDTVAKEIGQPLNGWDFKRSKGPQQVLPSGLNHTTMPNGHRRVVCFNTSRSSRLRQLDC